MISVGLGFVSLILNLLNPLNWVIGIVGLFWPAATQAYILNIFMLPLALIGFGIFMLFVSAMKVRK